MLFMSWKELMDVLVCPACRSKLKILAEVADESLACTSATCGKIYPVRDGIPILLVDQARDPK